MLYHNQILLLIIEIYWTNPQYLINLKDVDKDDNENKATVIISLMQKYNREKSKTDDYIHFRLYKVLKWLIKTIF